MYAKHSQGLFHDQIGSEGMIYLMQSITHNKSLTRLSTIFIQT